MAWRAIIFSDGRCFALAPSDWLNPVFAAVGVGNEPNAVSSVRGANVGSWNTVPNRIKPERGKVSENVCHSESKQVWDVLHDDEVRSNLANEAPVFRPQTRSHTFEASALASD
jgi:hypothetical protein